MGEPRVPPVWLDYNRSGEFRVRYPEGEKLPRFSVPSALLEDLEHEYLDPLALSKQAMDAGLREASWYEQMDEPWIGLHPTAPSVSIAPDLPNSWGALRDKREPVTFRVAPNPRASNDEPRSLIEPKHAARGLATRAHGGDAYRPGGPAFEEGTNPLTQAARREAATGAWVDELELGIALRALAPGMPRGAFGAWREGPGPGSAVVGTGVAAERAAPGVADTSSLEALLDGVWKGSRELGAGEAGGGGDDEPLDAPPPDEQVDAGEGRLLPVDSSGTREVLPEELQNLLGLDALPVWARWDVVALPGIEPWSKRRGEPQWATRTGVPDLAAAWEAVKSSLARSYRFELDTFQKEAILHMEAGRSVFVAAHTSAGKTAVAEYALSLATSHGTRAIYTSPIKAISNQKFRDFSEDYDVGLLTGDVQIKPDATCLIMTTEILRSMLYRGADLVRDIEWVVFDEVHYVNDAERGVVWEEVIILLPDHVNLLFLSATVPNVLEFADWVGRTKRRVVQVTGTTKRPVPLEHALFAADKLFEVGSGNTYEPLGYRKAATELAKRDGEVPKTKAETQRALPTGRGAGRGTATNAQGGGRGGARTGPGPGAASRSASIARAAAQGAGAGPTSGPRTDRSQWSGLLERLRRAELLPAIVFCFSRRRIDAIAEGLAGLDLTTQQEKHEIHAFCDRSLSRLRGGDRRLPQVLRVTDMLKRGIAVHHSGLLPIVKEVVEMLFCRGIIRVLFATETFAMGVNAPARTVVFQSLKKHDGVSFRALLPGEYTQMAGRAGRRGLDDVGTVVVAAWDGLPPEADLRRLISGVATRLESQFRLTYAMILNLLRVENLKVEDMLRRSFAEHHAQRAHPELAEKVAEGRAALLSLRAREWPESVTGSTREDLWTYSDLSARVAELDAVLTEALAGSRALHAALTPGRVVQITPGGGALPRHGVVVEARRAGSTEQDLSERRFVVLSLPPSGEEGAQDGSGGGTASLPASAPASAPLAGAPDPALRAFKSKKGQGDDAFGLSAGGSGRGKKGRRDDRRGGATLAPPHAAGPPVPLPHLCAAGGTSALLSELTARELANACAAKVQIDAAGVLAADPSSVSSSATALLRVIHQAGPGGPELLDPIADLRLSQIDLASSARERAHLRELIRRHKAHHDPALPEMFAMIWSERQLLGRLAGLVHTMSSSNLAQLPEFEQRVAVLQRLGYLDRDRMVTLKGRVACELNCGDELASAEIVFGGLLADLDAAETAALLSSLVFQERTDSAPSLTPRLQAACDAAKALAFRAGEVQAECGVPVSPEDYVRGALKFGLVEVVHAWASGMPFVDICQLTDVMEGTIVRAVVRLDEACREFRDAARVMGDTKLFALMDAASAAIKRDVVFAASLYVS